MSDERAVSKSERTGQKLDLLRSLAGSLHHAQIAIVRSDLAQLRRQTVEQENLCQQLQSLPGTCSTGNQALTGPLAIAADERCDEIASELARVEAEVRKLNREYGALLRRARRTVEAFCRVIAASDEITYLPPKPAVMAGAIFRE